MTCAWKHQRLQTHQSKDTSCKIKLPQISTTRVSWFSFPACYARSCSYMLGCERWELRYWQQIWQANLMTSHLRLVKKKQTSTPASSLLRGIWKRKLHQTSNAGNESNWEKVCPGSEGCEEVVEREQLLRISGEGMGAVEAPRAWKLNWRDGFGGSAARRLIPQSISRATVLCLDNGHHRISCTLPHTKNAGPGGNLFLASGI